MAVRRPRITVITAVRNEARYVRTAGQQFSDATVTSTIKTKLAMDPQLLNLASIDVDTNEGVVRLSGHVNTAEQKQEAEQLARETDGARKVVNDLDVGSERTLGRKVDDALITSKVKAKLTEDMNPFNVDVDTDAGVVTLSGRVKTAQDKSDAERIARQTMGVREVDNRLLVGDETP